jgi:hypothetical protein
MRASAASAIVGFMRIPGVSKTGMASLWQQQKCNCFSGEKQEREEGREKRVGI